MLYGKVKPANGVQASRKSSFQKCCFDKNPGFQRQCNALSQTGIALKCGVTGEAGVPALHPSSLPGSFLAYWAMGRSNLLPAGSGKLPQHRAPPLSYPCLQRFLTDHGQGCF
jgi:hypothetical protein